LNRQSFIAFADSLKPPNNKKRKLPKSEKIVQVLF